MRMKEPFEAYFDDYHTVNVYRSKNFFGGSSRIFHMKDSKDRITPLSIRSCSQLPNGYTQYALNIDGPIEIGEEYILFDEFAKSTPVIYSHIVKTEEFARQFACPEEDLGTVCTEKASIFRLWAPTAFRIQVQIQKDGSRIVRELKRGPKGIFELTLPGNWNKGQYTFLVRVNGQWKETVDPYTSFSAINSKASVLVDEKNLILPEKTAMPLMESPADAIVYEASIRDMTSQPGIGITHPKTFAGFVEETEASREAETGLAYLKTLGITHVQLMPVFDFGSVDERYPNLFYNWGYDPVQYRVPEGSYSLHPEDALARVKELADMVKTLHDNGIRVVLDVVFNHVYEKENMALEILVPNYYFLMNQNGDFSNGSFCGNDIDTQPVMSRKYFIDTCKRIIEWFDIDGFRFDLMGILDVNFMNALSEECRKLKPDFLLYGEGWNMPSFVPEDLRASLLNQHKMPAVGQFSDRFREAVRGSNGDLPQKGFVSGGPFSLYELNAVMSGGSADYSFDAPWKAVNYVECHDNHTLWDKNRSCCAGEENDMRESRQILAIAAVLMSQGMPFLHAGMEFGRSKQNEGNSYNKPDSLNHIDYSRRRAHGRILDAFKTLIQIRKDHPALRLQTADEVRSSVSLEMLGDNALIYRTHKGDDRIAVFYNPSHEEKTYILNDGGHVLYDSSGRNAGYTGYLQLPPVSVTVLSLTGH